MTRKTSRDVCFSTSRLGYRTAFRRATGASRANAKICLLSFSCKRKSNGHANEYLLDAGGLATLDLLDGSYTALHWIALLLDNRRFTLGSDYAAAMRELLLEKLLINLVPYDIVVGYRADDAYFSFAESFVEGTLSLRNLERASSSETSASKPCWYRKKRSVGSLS